tara:strand:+ start:247 stop:465 length:219 start_codon:yes stop_codon:yes gene_type:complete
VPIKFEVAALLLVKKESSLMLNVNTDKKTAKDRRKKSKPLKYLIIFANLSLKTAGIKLLFIYCNKYMSLDEK